ASRTPIIAGHKALPCFPKSHPQPSDRWIKAKGGIQDAFLATAQTTMAYIAERLSSGATAEDWAGRMVPQADGPAAQRT
ncbi:hypothetical protein, partial [Streptomyces sp. NPDC002133]|uniref:hypothetical protein n=1 Tax=Streptomyces sp. NPDC002133 TaxID=3154409 RepID=UPI00332E2156